MILEAFSTKDIQNLIALTTILEGDGITDLRFVRQRLQERLHSVGLDRRISAVKHRKGNVRIKFSLPCPTCGQPTGRVSVDGETIIACRACRWSALDEAR